MTSIQEDVHYDGGPARGDLIFNLLLGVTLIGLPFAIGAIVRAVWLRFRITSRRISVTGGWMGKEKTQVVYSQIKEVRTVPRGFGAWGDKVLVLTVDEKYIAGPLQQQLADVNSELNLDDATKIVGCWNGLAKRTGKAAGGADFGGGDFGGGDFGATAAPAVRSWQQRWCASPASLSPVGTCTVDEWRRVF